MAPIFGVNWKWESISSFFSSNSSSPNATPSLSSAEFAESSEQAATKQTDLPMPPHSAFGTVAGSSLPSPAESSTSTLPASERDYSAPNSPYSHHKPSVSTLSTATTASTAASTAPSDPNQKARSTSEEQAAAERRQAAEERLAAARRSAAHVVAPDIMSREFPKPKHQPSLEEMLAREPCKRSLGHYVKNYRERKLPEGPRTEAEFAERARAFEDTKKKLLADREKLDSLAAPRPGGQSG